VELIYLLSKNPCSGPELRVKYREMSLRWVPKRGTARAVLRLFLWTVLDRNHELQSRPDVCDRADLDIDQASIQPALAYHILSEVGGDARSFLRPRDPQHARWCQRPGCLPQFHLQPRARFGKEENKVEISIRDVLDPAFCERVAQFGRNLVRHMQQGNAEVVLDAQLFRQRSS